MAGRKKVYVPKAVPTTISAKVKLTVKIKDNYFSVEGNEERTIPVEAKDVDLSKEWDLLWEDVETVCDNELANIISEMRGKKV